MTTPLTDDPAAQLLALELEREQRRKRRNIFLAVLAVLAIVVLIIVLSVRAQKEADQERATEIGNRVSQMIENGG